MLAKNGDLVDYDIPNKFKVSMGCGGFDRENKYKGVPFGQSFACCLLNGGSIFVAS